MPTATKTQRINLEESAGESPAPGQTPDVDTPDIPTPAPDETSAPTLEMLLAGRPFNDVWNSLVRILDVPGKDDLSTWTTEFLVTEEVKARYLDVARAFAESDSVKRLKTLQQRLAEARNRVRTLKQDQATADASLTAALGEVGEEAVEAARQAYTDAISKGATCEREIKILTESITDTKMTVRNDWAMIRRNLSGEFQQESWGRLLESMQALMTWLNTPEIFQLLKTFRISSRMHGLTVAGGLKPMNPISGVVYHNFNDVLESLGSGVVLSEIGCDSDIEGYM
jgi:hypothetical protein